MIRYLFPAVLLFCTMTAAQKQQPEPTQDPVEGKVFRVDVNLVQVDAVVMDKEGRPVTDLTAEDFIILQDGKRQEITNFSRVQAEAFPAPGPLAQKQPAGPREALPSPLPAIQLKETQVRRVIALVVDDLGLSFSYIVKSRDMIRKWIDEEMQPGDLVAVITTGLGMGGLQQFTGDKRVLHNAIDRVRFNALSRIPASGLIPIVATNFDEERLMKLTLGTLEAMRYILKGMGALPGRKSLILFSQNLIMNFDEINRGVFQMNLSDSVKEKMDLMVKDANRATVVIHTIDPMGMDWMIRFVDASVITKSREGLPVMSQKTGGLFIRDRNNTYLGLKESAKDGETYYLLGYQPDEKTVAEMQTNKDRFHDIKVRVKRPGLEVRSRSGFSSAIEIPYAPAPSADALAQAMLSPLEHDDLMINLASGYVYDPIGKYILRAWVHLPGRQLTILRDNNGINYISLETYAATNGFDGLIRDSERMKHRIPLSNQEVLSVRQHGLRFSIAIPAKDPGAWFVRLAVKDQGSGRIGSAYQYVEIPDLKKGDLSLSDLFVINGNEDIRLILPETGGESPEPPYSMGRNREKSPAVRQYLPGESVQYLALIYNADTREGLPPDLETQTVLYRDGSEIFRSDPEAVDLNGITDSARIPIKKRLRLGKTMPPGDYMLQLQVRDRQAKKDQSLAARSLDFEVLPEQEPTNLEKAEISIRRGNEANRAGNKDESAQAFAEAARLYREELESNPDDTVLWKQTGTVSFLAGQTNQAVAAYEEAARLDPEDAEAHYMLGIILATNDVESAIGNFREAVRLNPENAKYHFDMGRALAHKQDYEAAIKTFSEAARLDPEDGESHASMGIVLEQMGEMEEATAEYQKALALNLSDGSAESVRLLLKKVLAEIEDPAAEKRREY